MYRVFVHRTIFEGNFHNRIVLCDKGEKHGFVTLELGKNDTYSRVVPKCQVYQGKEEDLEFKGTVEATMRALANVAIGILREMGDYRLVGNNCQNRISVTRFLPALISRKASTGPRPSKLEWV